MIFDSRIIYNYLSDKLDHEGLSWEEENQLTLIDAANDSFEAVLSALSQQLDAGGFSGWTYPEICLYTMIDWVLFRELHDIKDYPQLLEFHEQHHNRIEVTATDPRS